MTTDSIAALLREVAEFGDHGGVSNYDLRQRARAALEHYRWRDKPDKPGWWWMQKPARALEAVRVQEFNNEMRYDHDGRWHHVPERARWCPVLPPPPREGE